MGTKQTVKTTEIDYKTLVQLVEGGELLKKPVVYYWPGGNDKVDSGPNSGIYEPPATP